MEKKLSGKMTYALKILLPLILGLPWILSGCAKDGGVCLNTSGEIIRQVRNVSYFNQIDIQDNVNLILSTDTGNAVTVEAGQNIIGGITTNIADGKLLIRNNNKCNWLRDYSKPINVYISTGNLWKILYNGSGNISSKGILKQDSISIEVWGGCGTIDLRLDVWQGSFSLNMGTVDFRLHGVCAISSVFSGDYGLFDARDMKTGYTFITSRGSNDCYVWAVNQLNATINSIGNIYYSGDPKSINARINGAGKLLPF
jgi:hypothetical protein